MREGIIQKLVDEFGETSSSFNNTETNKQREKFWTYNRLVNYYRKLVDKRDEALVEQFELEDFDKRDAGF
jgi:hypothetical protein